MHKRFTQPVNQILAASGWHPRRSVDFALDSKLKPLLFNSASIAVAEFAGLHIKVDKIQQGIDLAPSDIEFNPNLCVHFAHELEPLGRAMKTRLFPLGEFCVGEGFLVIDAQGRVYEYSDQLKFIASCLDRAIELLLLGEEYDDPRTECDTC